MFAQNIEAVLAVTKSISTPSCCFMFTVLTVLFSVLLFLSVFYFSDTRPRIFNKNNDKYDLIQI